MEEKLHSLMKREVFGPIVQTPKVVKLVGINRYFCKSVMKIMRS